MKSYTHNIHTIKELAKFPEANPNCVMRLDSKLKVLFKNKATDKLLEENGFSKNNIQAILPKNIRKKIKESLAVRKTILNIETNIHGRTYCYTVAPVPNTQHVNIYGLDITQRVEVEELLKRSEKLLTKQAMQLEQKTIALEEVLRHSQQEKHNLKRSMQRNIYESIMPIIQKLKSRLKEKQEILLLERTLKTVLELEAGKIIPKFPLLRLSSRELEICNFIKSGMSSKEIASLLNISFQTVEKHRRNIRKKLRIDSKSVNLASFLQTYEID